jgi:D-alanyl-D-alanine carboxypeptidase (penicillin-binding protein 5/6)
MKSRKKVIYMVLLVFLAVCIAPLNVQAEELSDVTADAYVLMDADSGQVLLSKNEHKQLAPASMTKLMTLVLATEALEEGRVDLKDKVTASENAWKLGGSQIYLEPGEVMTYEEMLIAIAVGSANDACVAVAEHLDGTHEAFVENMNRKARMLGLKNTNFINSYGLTAEKHYTSAYDMAVMGRYALNFTKILEYSAIKEYKLRQGEFVLYNTNKLLWWYEGADGFKTGWTNEAKYCLASTAKRDSLRLISVVMGCPEPRGHFRDSMKILNYGFAKYAYKSFYSKDSICGTVKVGKGTQEIVEVKAEEDIGSIHLKGKEKGITITKNLLPYVNAPVKENQKLGTLRVYRDGELFKEVNMLAVEDVPRSGLIKGILKMLAETYLL